MKKRISAHQLVDGSVPDVQLSFKEALFVSEYMKDCSPRRAAEASGYSPDYGTQLIEKPHVQQAIAYILSQRTDLSLINAEWLLYEFVDNHALSRQQGNIPASTAALVNIGKHKMVDAFVAKELKVEVNTNAELLERLKRGRERNAAAADPDQETFF